MRLARDVIVAEMQSFRAALRALTAFAARHGIDATPLLNKWGDSVFLRIEAAIQSDWTKPRNEADKPVPSDFGAAGARQNEVNRQSNLMPPDPVLSKLQHVILEKLQEANATDAANRAKTALIAKRVGDGATPESCKAGFSLEADWLD